MIDKSFIITISNANGIIQEQAEPQTFIELQIYLISEAHLRK